MRLPRFQYVEPKSIQEATSILYDDPTAKILAGGTDLLVNMKHRVETPSVVVNIKKISGLDTVQHESGAIRIGALTSLKNLSTDPFIAERLPALAWAASSVGSYHHQTMGTIGGNICQQNRCKFYNQSKWWRSSRPPCFKAGGDICHVVNKKGICYSSYCGDLAPVLLILNARVSIQSHTETREISIESLFSEDGKSPLNLERGEILTEVIIPDDAKNGSSSYTKFANRGSIDFPIVGMAFWASMEKKDFRVAFTAVDRKPIRAKNIENFLNGKDLNEEVVEELYGLIPREATPVKTSIYSPSYKRRIMGLLLRRMINEAVGRSKR